jgi:hypothetical protein
MISHGGDGAIEAYLSFLVRISIKRGPARDARTDCEVQLIQSGEIRHFMRLQDALNSIAEHVGPILGEPDDSSS